MEDRYANIVNLLSSNISALEMAKYFSPYMINGSTEVDRNQYGRRYEIKRECSMVAYAYPDITDRNERTFLLVYPPESDDDIITITIEHYFGSLGLVGSDNYSNVGILCSQLSQNIGSYLGSGAYLGLTVPKNQTVYATLNSTHHFLDEWSDEHIAKILTYQIANLYKALENNWDDSCPIIKRFGD